MRGRHPFYRRLNKILERIDFDGSVERLCRNYYAPKTVRPSIAFRVYFRCFLVGHFEGIGSERGIAYRVSRSLSLQEFLVWAGRRRRRTIRRCRRRGSCWGPAAASVWHAASPPASPPPPRTLRRRSLE